MTTVSNGMGRSVCRFGDYELDRLALELRRSGEKIKLAPQPARVLRLLEIESLFGDGRASPIAFVIIYAGLGDLSARLERQYRTLCCDAASAVVRSVVSPERSQG